MIPGLEDGDTKEAEALSRMGFEPHCANLVVVGEQTAHLLQDLCGLGRQDG